MSYVNKNKIIFFVCAFIDKWHGLRAKYLLACIYFISICCWYISDYVDAIPLLINSSESLKQQVQSIIDIDIKVKYWMPWMEHRSRKREFFSRDTSNIASVHTQIFVFSSVIFIEQSYKYKWESEGNNLQACKERKKRKKKKIKEQKIHKVYVFFIKL